MDAIKAAFESQFGTEWSSQVNGSGSVDSKENSTNTKDHVETGPEDSDSDAISEELNSYGESDSQSSEDDEPISIKHNEESHHQQATLTKSQRRKFMGSGAPKDDSVIPNKAPQTSEDKEDLKNDLALQRLIEESHILSERPKGQEFSGADISGAGDPLELIGSSRLRVMESRLAQAGAKTKSQRMPQAMAVGIRDKAKERKDKYRNEAREAGIVIAKERHMKSKNKFRDRGLKINTVGRASEHGIHISAAEIARLTGKNKKLKRR